MTVGGLVRKEGEGNSSTRRGNERGVAHLDKEGDLDLGLERGGEIHHIFQKSAMHNDEGVQMSAGTGSVEAQP